MEVVAEKKEGDNIQSLVDPSLTPNADKELAEDRERQARDLKAGLHPLKVSLLFLSLNLNLSIRTYI